MSRRSSHWRHQNRSPCVRAVRYSSWHASHGEGEFHQHAQTKAETDSDVCPIRVLGLGHSFDLFKTVLYVQYCTVLSCTEHFTVNKHTHTHARTHAHTHYVWTEEKDGAKKV
jgi:hypothetical protein